MERGHDTSVIAGVLRSSEFRRVMHGSLQLCDGAINLRIGRACSVHVKHSMFYHTEKVPKTDNYNYRYACCYTKSY